MFIFILYITFNSMENVMRTNSDTTMIMVDDNPYYDLIFTPAGEVITSDNVKRKNCECGDCGDCNDWKQSVSR